MNILGEKVC